MDYLKNEEIAKILGQHCFDTNADEIDFAVQLFIEKVVLPEDVISYDASKIEKYILEYLNNL